ncbi:MAG: ion channel [Pseudomonadota bacterium]
MGKQGAGLMSKGPGRRMLWVVLLALLLVALAFEPLFGASTVHEIVRLVLLQMSVVGALFVSAPPGRLRTLCLVVSGIWFVAAVLSLTFDPFHGMIALLSLLMLFASLLATFANLIKREDVDVEGLLEGIYGYFLLAMVWAILFVQIERWLPGAFRLPDGRDLSVEMIYFSLVTLTTLGYGDVLPVAPAAQFAAGMEAAVGVLYVAVLIGSMVGSYQSRRRQ